MLLLLSCMLFGSNAMNDDVVLELHELGDTTTQRDDGDEKDDPPLLISRYITRHYTDDEVVRKIDELETQIKIRLERITNHDPKRSSNRDKDLNDKNEAAKTDLENELAAFRQLRKSRMKRRSKLIEPTSESSGIAEEKDQTAEGPPAERSGSETGNETDSNIDHRLYRVARRAGRRERRQSGTPPASEQVPPTWGNFCRKWSVPAFCFFGGVTFGGVLVAAYLKIFVTFKNSEEINSMLEDICMLQDMNDNKNIALDVCRNALKERTEMDCCETVPTGTPIRAPTTFPQWNDWTLKYNPIVPDTVNWEAPPPPHAENANNIYVNWALYNDWVREHQHPHSYPSHHHHQVIDADDDADVASDDADVASDQEEVHPEVEEGRR